MKPMIQSSDSYISSVDIESQSETLQANGRTIQRGYILNNTAALKKKIRHESHRDPYDNGSETKDGSNMVVLLKTSFFEHVKGAYIKDVQCMEGITSDQNVVGTKVNSESSGEAFVEFSLDIHFQVQDVLYKIKLTAYTTTCKILFQPIDIPVGTKVVSSNKFIPRFFVEKYFLPGVRQHT